MVRVVWWAFFGQDSFVARVDLWLPDVYERVVGQTRMLERKE